MFKEAFFGIKYALGVDTKLRLFLLMFVGIYMVNVFLDVDIAGSAATIICAGWTISAEIFNTAIEHLCDRITIAKDYDIMLVKDMSGGAVLLACAVSVLVATLVYVPKLMELIGWK